MDFEEARSCEEKEAANRDASPANFPTTDENDEASVVVRGALRVDCETAVELLLVVAVEVVTMLVGAEVCCSSLDLFCEADIMTGF